MYPAAVIFDFDGVIVDTEPLHYQAFQKILTPRNLGYSWDDYLAVYMGFDDRDAFREAFAQGGVALSEGELEQLIAHKAVIFQEVIASGVAPYPGVTALIHKLHEQGTPLAICSGALRSDILPIIDQLGVASFFSLIITADDVPHSKPDPTCYRIAAQQLIAAYSDQLSPDAHNIIAIEDTPAGISSAKGAGLMVVAVSNSYPAERLQQADRIVASLEELQTGHWI
ncbi:HAD family phosphatase [Trichlorobacter sp.]|jgi:beta-phosphoglucomutase|uniref:HAD family hydrolase n=1 Tax=Trichlorobacter sp. TaxID=2911007 RepID=UPI002A36CB65|nr:HAD family phosphatase [Trichlorobacter sp.]MDY0383583.1 HAD family phosphatase [Trichlorobacter sp.]